MYAVEVAPWHRAVVCDCIDFVWGVTLASYIAHHHPSHLLLIKTADPAALRPNSSPSVLEYQHLPQPR